MLHVSATAKIVCRATALFFGCLLAFAFYHAISRSIMRGIVPAYGYPFSAGNNSVHSSIIPLKINSVYIILVNIFQKVL